MQDKEFNKYKGAIYLVVPLAESLMTVVEAVQVIEGAPRLLRSR